MHWLALASLLGFGHFVIGGLWYSPLLFGKAWMRGMGITVEDIAEARVNMKAALATSLLLSIAQSAALAAVLRFLPEVGLLEAAGIGGGLALAMCVTPMLKDRVWADRPWPVILVDGGYEVVACAAVAVSFVALGYS